MAAISYAPRASSDLLRLVDFLAESDPPVAAETADLIVSAVNALQHHPLLGRTVPGGHPNSPTRGHLKFPHLNMPSRG